MGDPPVGNKKIYHLNTKSIHRALLSKRLLESRKILSALTILSSTIVCGFLLPARVVMEILGHSQFSLTMDTYSHVIPTLQREAADRMEALFAASR